MSIGVGRAKLAKSKSKEPKKKNPLIIGNWKMQLSVPESTVMIERLKKDLAKIKNTEVVLCPSFVDLYPASKEVAGTNIKIGAQNLFYEDEGAYTGEISPLMLKGFAKYVIIGHSERRAYLKEDNKMVAQKVEAAARNDLMPVICVGDTFQERNDGLTRVSVLNQLEAALHFLTPKEVEKTVIAYEPIWAVGTGKNCSPKKASEIISNIRYDIKRIYGEGVSKNIRILYGGSVDSKNVLGYFREEEIDGLLIGGASLRRNEFVKIVKSAERVGKKR